MQETEALTVAYRDPKLPAAMDVPAGKAWTGLLQHIDTAQAETLCAVIHTLYPHEAIPERCYQRAVYHLDRRAGVPDAAAIFTKFLGLLAEKCALPFAELAETYQVQALRQIESTPEFFFVQRSAVRYFYDDVEIWAKFGYEGASTHLGGYVQRGFDDLDWLPPLPNDF